MGSVGGDIVLHGIEAGEVAAGENLDPRWADMLTTITSVKTEICIRAVRDHLADCLITLPALLKRGDPGPIHLYFANLQGMRKELFPRLVAAYDRWLRDGALGELQDLLPGARVHWQGIADNLLAIFDDRPEDPRTGIDELVENLIDGQARY